MKNFSNYSVSSGKILFSIVFLLISCSSEEVYRQKVDIEQEIVPDQVAYEVDVAFVDSSFTKAVLKAGRARIFEDRKETLLDSSVRVDFYEKGSYEIASTLTSDSASIDDRTKNMLARGNVVVVSEDSKRRLTTEILEWDNYRQKLFSTEFVTITTEQEIIKGYGFESDPNLTNYKINKVSGIQTRR